jgi:hypothetical protein
VGSRVIKPSISKLNILSKLINPIKYRFRRYIRLWLRWCGLKVISKLLKLNNSYILLDDILSAISG